jgi:hypothetical protein
MSLSQRNRRLVRSVRPFGGFVFPKRGWRDRQGAHREELRLARLRAQHDHPPQSLSATKGTIVMSQTKTMQLVGAIERSGGAGKKTWWTRIGVAFQNKDGSYNLRFDYLPHLAGTTIQMREMDATEAAPTE